MVDQHRLSVFQILKRVHRVGRTMHPHISFGSIRHQLKLLWSAVTHLPVLRQWYGTSDNPLRIAAVARFPLIEGAIYWPYINHAWPMAKRLTVIDQHYRLLHGPAAIIATATLSDVELAIPHVEYAGLKLVLEKAPWFLREGEIVLSLFAANERLYSVAFTLGLEAGQTTAYIGALQGRNLPNAMEIYRDITHALHGMRPRDFLLTAARLLCGAISVTKLWAVCSDLRQHNGSYFSGSHQDKVAADYDEVWIEQGGEKLENGFFVLPIAARQKEMSEIPSRKRAAYRRRYAMLDQLADDIRATCTLASSAQSRH
jgi:uncharacterized protein VirK/YbjX